MIKAKDIMTREIITITPETEIAQAAKLLLEKRINGVPVVNEVTRKAEDNGAKIVRPAGPLQGGTMVISFIEDIDGYRIEFVPEILS